MMIRGYAIGARVIGAFIFVAAIAVMVFAGPAACQKIRSLTAQSKVNSAQSGAFTNSAGDAIGTVGAAGQREAGSEALGRDNARDIMNAGGARVPANPALNRAGRSALCKRDAYRNSPQCKEPTP